MKGDAFDQMAKVAFDKAEQIDWKATSWEAETAKALRAQHRKVRRMVSSMSGHFQGERAMLSDQLGSWVRREDILMALDAMKGTGNT